MDISLKLNKDFEKALGALVDEFGEDFEILNGIHYSQMLIPGTKKLIILLKLQQNL